MPKSKVTKTRFGELDFGAPEAERDQKLLETAFFESRSWKRLAAIQELAFLIGRKGAGKTAIVTRLEIDARRRGPHSGAFLKIVPADFHQFELRSLLQKLVSEDHTWQYVYKTIWEGILFGQIAKLVVSDDSRDTYYNMNHELRSDLVAAVNGNGLFVGNLSSSITDSIDTLIDQSAAATDPARAPRRLRQALEFPHRKELIRRLNDQARELSWPRAIVAIDGLDDHWDKSPPALHFLAALLLVTSELRSQLSCFARLVVCLRDNIFRALVETHSVEYDKIEASVEHLSWESEDLLELIARRAFPWVSRDDAIWSLKNHIPQSIDGTPIEDYLARRILKRPRDYVNLFSYLKAEALDSECATEQQFKEAATRYSSQRLVDLENEFAQNYPRLAEVIQTFSALPDLVSRHQVETHLQRVVADPDIRRRAPQLMELYGDAKRLLMILLSVGALGISRDGGDRLEFVQEFNEARISERIEGAQGFGLHPVYLFAIGRESEKGHFVRLPVVTEPVEYVATEDNKAMLETAATGLAAKRRSLVREVESIATGREHFKRFEKWVENAIRVSFLEDLANAAAQTPAGERLLEIVFDIVGTLAPWDEIKSVYATFRLLVECKNTDEPSDADFGKLERDMDLSKVRLAFLVYRSRRPDPEGAVVKQIRSRYNASNRQKVIIAVTEAKLVQCLEKRDEAQRRRVLSALVRTHLLQYLAV